MDTDIVQFTSEQNGTTDASGRQYDLDEKTEYCGPGWGRKFCRFLKKYDDTVWADSENYYSDFSDIRFSNFGFNGYFISFFDIDSTTSYCSGWRVGETTQDGIKWDIKIKKDEEDTLWFDYSYYGSSNEAEYITTYKYEVVDSLLHFSTSDGQTFTFHPSERNYAKDQVDTEDIVISKGCIFYW